MRHFPLLLLSALACAAPASHASVELHAHLFMKEGLTWFFRGGFDEPLRATSWRDRFSSQANPEALEKSGLKIVVASLYAYPLLTLGLRDSIRRQLDQAEAFVRNHPAWVIARSGDEAEKALGAGKRVLILALEGASGIIEDEEDLVEFVDRRGIRIVNLVHFIDDRYGGVALFPGVMGLLSPIAWLRNRFSGTRGGNGVRINDNGLELEGRSMALALIKRGVWLDLAHASDRAQEGLLPMLEKAGQPPLYTHTSPRARYGAERAISDAQLAEVKRLGGIVGLMPSEDMLHGTQVPPDLCPMACAGACEGGIHALAVQYREVAARIGADAVALGSDTNGGISHLRPSCGTGTSLDREQGLWNLGQSSEVWQALRKLGAPVPADEARVKRFVSAWKKVVAQ